MYNKIVVLGIMASILFTELTGLSPAGIIVPGYIVLSLRTPRRIVYTIIVALLAWAISRVLSNFVIIYGRRRFAMMILIAFFIDLTLGYTIKDFGIPSMIGILVPGIMASEFEKQGVFKSLFSLGIVVGILSLVLISFDIGVFSI